MSKKIIFIIMLILLVSFVSAVDEVTLERTTAGWRGTYAELKIPGVTYEGTINRLFVVPSGDEWVIRGNTNWAPDYKDVGRIKKDGSITLDNDRLRIGGVRNIPDVKDVKVDASKIKTQYNTIVDTGKSYTPANLVVSTAPSTAAGATPAAAPATHITGTGLSAIKVKDLNKGDTIKNDQGQDLIIESKTEKAGRVELVFKKQDGTLTSPLSYNPDSTLSDIRASGYTKSSTVSTYTANVVLNVGGGVQKTVPFTTTLDPADQRNQEAIKKAYLAKYPGANVQSVQKAAGVSVASAKEFEIVQVGPDLYERKLNGVTYKGDGKSAVSKKLADEWLLEQQKKKVEKTLTAQKYTIRGTSSEGIVVYKDGKYSIADADTGKIVNENPSSVTLDEGDKNGVSIKTTYNVKTVNKKQVLDFSLSTIDGRVVINDKAVFDELKTKIGKLDKSLVEVGTDSIIVRAKTTNIKTYEVKKVSNEEIVISDNFVGGKPLSEKTFILSANSGGLTTKTYEARYYNLKGEVISVYKWNKLKKEEKGEVVRVLKNYRNDFYAKNDKGQRDMTKIKSSAIGTVWINRIVDDKGKVSYTYDINTEILVFNADGTKIDDRFFVYSENVDPRFNADGSLSDNQPSGVIAYDKDGKIISSKSNYDGAKIQQRGDKALKQAASRRFFKVFELSLTQFHGLRGWWMLLDKEGAASMAASVDRWFSEHMLGVDYWVSEICKHEYDKSIEGVAFADLPDGVVMPQAYVAGEKSSFIPYQDENGELGYQRLYKLTFYVRASYQDVSFNVLLDGKQLYPSNIMLRGDEEGDGEEYSATGSLAIVQYSTNEYSKICIDFSAGPMDDICNNIVVSDGSVDNYLASGGPVATESAPGQHNAVVI